MVEFHSRLMWILIRFYKVNFALFLINCFLTSNKKCFLSSWEPMIMSLLYLKKKKQSVINTALVCEIVCSTLFLNMVNCEYLIRAHLIIKWMLIATTSLNKSLLSNPKKTELYKNKVS